MQETKEKNELITYDEFINNILDTRGRFSCGEEYHERHHVVPKCMGGTDEEDNLIDLFAREHFEAHRLLALENPENSSLTYAWWMMAHCGGRDYQDRYELTAEEYEEARIEFSKKMSESKMGDKNPMYNKPVSEDTKLKLSKANKGKCLSDETKKKIGDAHRGIPLSEEHRRKLSENHAHLSGENHPMYGKHMSGKGAPMYGKHHTQESREKMSKSRQGKYVGENAGHYGKRHSEESCKKISEAVPKKKVICLTTGTVYESVKKAAEDTGVLYPSNISKCCLGKHKSAGKHPVTGEPLVWAYYTDTQTQQNN